ncbi:MAG: HAD-IA family hydrolase [Pseudomonadales bacterium]
MADRPMALVLDPCALLRYRPERRLMALARASGLDAVTVRKRLFDSGFMRSCEAGQINAEASGREIARLLGRRWGPAQLRELWASAFEADADMLGLMHDLRRRFSLALLGNSSLLERDALEQRFDTILELLRPRLYSAEVGRLKPDPGLYATLLGLLGLSPGQVLLVDPAPQNIAGAAALGWQTHLFEGAAGLRTRLLAQ